MGRAWLGRIAATILIVAMLVASAPTGLRAQGADNIGALNKQVVQLYGQGKYKEAAAIAEKVLALAERALGPEHPLTLRSVNNLAELYRVQGRYDEAEPLFQRALAASERALGLEHPFTLLSLNNLAELYRVQGRYGEAEPLCKRALAGRERALGPEHPDTLLSVNNLAALYQSQGRYGEAEPLDKRALAGRERTLGPEHPDTLQSVNSLAVVYRSQGRYGEAEPLYKRALAAQERVLGPEHPQTLQSVNNLAALYQAQGRYGEAEPLDKRALAGRERTLGPEHPDTLLSVNNLAVLYKSQGRYGEAEPLYSRALAASERALGPEHPDTLRIVNSLAAFYFERSDWARAAEFWRRSTTAIAARTRRDAASQTPGGKKKSETEQLSWQFWGLVKAVDRLAPEGGSPDANDAREMFLTAQWAQSSEAAASLAQMAARGAKGDARLAALARERQDLVAEWQKRDGQRNKALALVPDKRDAQAEAENNARLTAIDTRITEIDKELAAKFPDYSALASPAPIAVEDVQAQLGRDEALVLFLDTQKWQQTPEETFIWVMTKTDLRWVRTDLGTAALAREVQALRCGLDAASWEGQSTALCFQLLNIPIGKAPKDGEFFPFDLARAHALYKALFGKAEDLIKDKSLILVPSGPLTQLPFQVLVTKPPQGGDYKSAAWLARDHALAVLPAVSSLKALRRVARPSAATKPMIGFGNPLLDGRQSDPEYGEYFKQRAVLARKNQSCPVTPARTSMQRLASLFGLRRGVAPMPTRGLADTALLKAQAPLPETRDELCAVARDLGADPGEMRLGARATEREVKGLSASGALAQYRIVHFATHGVLAGQLDPKSEPGLILTPPDSPSEGDDGYLTASETAALKLDADWVILSACNTAAGGAAEAQALSGLARAFFYAQARALLVSHWEVDSDATVKLITAAVREIARDKRVGRAEALRRSMLALIDHGTPQEAHPAFWAPFVLVGEGAAAR